MFCADANDAWQAQHFRKHGLWSSWQAQRFAHLQDESEPFAEIVLELGEPSAEIVRVESLSLWRRANVT